MADTLPTIESSEILQNIGVVRAGSVAEGLTSGIQSFAASTRRTAQRLERQAIDAATDEGRNAGIARDEDGNLTFQPRTGDTPMDKAFNDAGKQMYMASFINDQRQNFTQMRRQTGDDSLEFEKQAGMFSTSLLNNVPDQFKAEAELELESLMRQNVNAILNVERQNAWRLQNQTIAGARASIIQDMQALAKVGQAGGEEYRRLAKQFEENLQGAVSKGYMTPELADIERNMLADDAEALGIAHVSLQTYHRMGGGIEAVEAANKEMQQILDSPELSGISAARRAQIVNRQQEAIREAESIRNSKVRALEAEARPALRRLALGFPVSPGKIAAYAEQARALNDPILSGELQMAADRQLDVATFARLPLGEQQARMATINDTLMAGGGDDEDVQRLLAYQKANAEKARAIDADPLSYGAEAHPQQVGELEALDFAQPDTLVASFQKRVEQADRTADLEGLPKSQVLPLTANEVDRLSTTIASMDATSKAVFAASLADGFGARRLPQVLNALVSNDAESRTFAVAAGIAVDRPKIAREIFIGQDVIKSEKGVLPANNSTFRTELTELRQALWRRPDSAGAITDAVLAVYAYDSNSKGDFTGTLDPDRLDRAITAVVGNIVEYNGAKMIAPQPGMDSSDFARTMFNLTDADLGEPLYARDGRQITADDIRDFGELASVGDGRYEVRIGGMELTNADGSRYLLDLSNVAPREIPSTVTNRFLTGARAGAK
jgi:hypothetical protein